MRATATTTTSRFLFTPNYVLSKSGESSASYTIYIYIALYIRNAKGPDSVASYARFARPLAVSNYRLAVAQETSDCVSVCLRKMSMTKQEKWICIRRRRRLSEGRESRARRTF